MNAVKNLIPLNATRLVALLLSYMVLQSCYPLIYAEKTINLTNKPRFHGGYSIEAIYELKRPLIYDGQRGVADHFYWPGISSGTRVAYEQYVNSPTSYPGISIVPKGTRFKFVKMIYTNDPWKGGFAWISGKFINGPFASTEFDLTGVSTIHTDEQWKPRRTERISNYDVTLFWPDPKFVKVVQE